MNKKESELLISVLSKVVGISKYNIKSKKYILIFTDDFTKNLEGSRYKYNIMYFVGDERYPQCANSDIVVNGVINSYEGN